MPSATKGESPRPPRPPAPNPPTTSASAQKTARSPGAPTTVHRIEVSTAKGQADPIGESLRRDAAAMGVVLSSSRATHVYLIQPAPEAPISPSQLESLRTGLLTDPVIETSLVGAAPVAPGSQIIEIHPLPGVMDPVAQSVQGAIQELLGLRTPPRVATGWRYDLEAPAPGLRPEQAASLAGRLLANSVIHKVHTAPYHPDHFPESVPHAGGSDQVRLIDLADADLVKLARDAHLFLSLEEMQAIQAHYRAAGRNPRQIELETLAQTWSEHCVHKTIKATVRYRSVEVPWCQGVEEKAPKFGPSTPRHLDTLTPSPLDTLTPDLIDWSNRPGHEVQADGSVLIHNLLKSTVAAATRRLIADGLDWTLSVFVDNSGVIAFDEQTAVCIKVETHNHPSAIEPYGGAATGVGGCIRDVIGTGLGARPIANTDVFCVAFPDHFSGASGAPGALPEGCLHPRRILTQVVTGVRDYGNRMGIPTVSGAVAFDDRYVGNPLVFCGCIGVMPRHCVQGAVQSDDLIVAIGGRTGRDGIHGATFSSAELEHTATDEFAHAVQIGNAITEKQTLDAILRARDEFAQPLYRGLTDCGAGGFSSAIGEMGRATGATVHLDKAPLKYAGLSPTEIWISEAQERMVLAVPPENIGELSRICDEEGVELAVLGVFAAPEGSSAANPDLRLLYHGQEVGRLSMHLLHDGLPTPRREAVWPGGSDGVTELRRDEVKSDAASVSTPSLRHSVTSSLLRLLRHPTIASKHWIIRQFDHEVRGATVIKPLVGPLSRGPGDASIITPVPGSSRALAISCGLATGVGDPKAGGDPYLMAIAAIDECVRNLVCVGADPDRIAILDNFCWPGCTKPENLGALVRAAEGCYDGALAYRTPFVSGKDSLNNQFSTRDGRVIEIPPTLLITGVGIVPDLARACTMDAKRPGSLLVLVGQTQEALGGSIYRQIAESAHPEAVPTTNLKHGPSAARAVASLIRGGLVASAHDVSDGGLLCTVAEMLIAGSSQAQPIGAAVDLRAVARDTAVAAFGESPSRYVLEIAPADQARVQERLRTAGIAHSLIGTLDDSGRLWSIGAAFEAASVEDLARAWLAPLDW